MAINVSQMRANLRYGGARPTLFQATITNPVDGSGDLKTPFMIQAASIPEFVVGSIPIPFMGRSINVPGDRQFQPWGVEVMNDEDFVVRNAFETWNNKINTLETNIRDLPTSEAVHYTSTAIVKQLNKRGEPIRTYEFLNAWPMMIGPIQLAWGATDTIEVFPVTLVYDYFRVLGPTGDAGGI